MILIEETLGRPIERPLKFIKQAQWVGRIPVRSRSSFLPGASFLIPLGIVISKTRVPRNAGGTFFSRLVVMVVGLLKLIARVWIVVSSIGQVLLFGILFLVLLDLVLLDLVLFSLVLLDLDLLQLVGDCSTVHDTHAFAFANIFSSSPLK